MEQIQLSPEEQVRQVVATMAIENLYPDEEMLKRSLLQAQGKITIDKVIQELKLKYDRS